MTYPSTGDFYEDFPKQLEDSRSLIAANWLSEGYQTLTSLHTKLEALPPDHPAKSLLSTVGNDLADLRTERAPTKAKQARTTLETLLNRTLTLPAPKLDFRFDLGDAWLAERLRDVESVIAQLDAETNSALRNWEDALLGVSSGDYERYAESLVRIHRESQEQLLIAQAGRETCQHYWTEASQLIDQDVSPDRLQTWYDKAAKVASNLYARHQGNAVLALLAEEAERVRSESALANQIFTSAVQASFYRRSLSELKSLKPNATVPIYDFITDQYGNKKEQFVRRATAAEALPLLREQARIWADEQATLAINNATRALEAHDPNAALTALDKLSEFQEFLDNVVIQDFAKLREKASAEKSALDKATKKAEQAQSFVRTDVPTALRLLDEAARLYAWSPRIEEVREELSRNLVELIDKEYERAKDAREKIPPDFSTIERAAQNGQKSRYPQLEDTVAKFDPLDTLAKEAEQLRLRLDRARNTLHEIERMALQNPANARQQFERFQTDFKDVRIPYAEFLGVGNVAQALEGATNAAVELERLGGFVRVTDARSVDTAIKDAQAAYERFNKDSRFQVLISQLELHLEFVAAEQELALDRLDSALVRYQRVSADPTHPDFNQAKSRIVEVGDYQRQDTTTEGAIADAQAMLQNNDPTSVYKRLQQLRPRRDDLVKRRDQALREAKNKAQTQLEVSLSAIEKAEMFPLAEVQEYLDALRYLGLDADYERWQKKLNFRILAAQAEAADPEDAGELWAKAATAARAAKQPHTVIRQYETAERESRKEAAKQRVGALQKKLSRADSDNAQLQGDIQELQTYLTQLQRDYEDDVDITLWLAETNQLVWQFSYAPRRRREYAEQAGRVAAEALRLTNADKKDKNYLRAEQMVGNAKLGVELTEVMLTIEEYLTKPAARFSDLVFGRNLWYEKIQPHTVNEVFKPLERWWHTVQANTAKTLRSRIEAERRQLKPDMLVLKRMQAGVLLMDSLADRSMIEALPDWADQVWREVEDLKANLGTAENIVAKDGQAKLDQQLQLAEGLSDTLSTIKDFEEAFKDDPRFTVTETELSAGRVKALTYAATLQHEVIEPLAEFQKQLGALRSQLALDQKSGNFETSNRLSKQLSFSRHPAAIDLKEVLNGAETEAQKFKALVDQVRHLLEHEAYLEAYDLMQSQDEADLSAYGVLDSFSFADPVNGRTVKTWEDAKSLAEERLGVDSRIVEFIEIFDDYSEGKGRYARREKPSRPLLDWKSYEKSIAQFIRSGKFNDARDEVEKALKGEATKPTSGDSKPLASRTVYLNEALEKLAFPPVKGSQASRSKDYAEVVKRYEAAINTTDSSYGQQALDYLKQAYIQVFQWCEDANNLFRQIDEAEIAWKAGRQRWEEGMTEAGRLLEQTRQVAGWWRLNFGGVRQSLRNAVETARSGYEQCRKACPAHPLLKEMYVPENAREGLWLYRRAARLARVRLTS